MSSNIRFLSRQGIPLRGDGDGNTSNFTHIVHLRTEDNPALSMWLVKKTNKYTSWQMKNEMLKVMALARLPARYEDGNAPAKFYETSESRYRHF